MIVELGHYCLVLALSLALFQSIFPLWGALKNDAALMQLAPMLAIAQFVFVALAFGALTYAHVVSDFSLSTVVANSHSAKPLLYRVTGVWGNHEGSMLLWVLALSISGTAYAVFSKSTPATLRASVLGVQAWIGTAFLFFILLTSNPFQRSLPAPLEGRDLNPLLQDIGLAIHPPLLYLGYVGFSLCYAFAMAALISGRADQAWARFMRPWCLAAWIFLTLGVAMGSYWAYYELGWGGFWFWDPVENASFMPWLCGAMLLHSAMVMEKRGALSRWTLLLALASFSLSLIGTFLVRSGVLTSVHTFANDPARGMAILLILCMFIGGSLALYAWRAPHFNKGEDFAPVSRESALVLNNIFLSAATAAVFTGTLYPLLLEALTGEKISVGPPYFNLTFGWTMVPLLLLLPFGPFLAWKRGNLVQAVKRMTGVIILSLSGGALLLWQQPQHLAAACGIALAVYVMAGSIADLLFRAQVFSASPRESIRRLIGQKLSHLGTALAHFGVGLFLLGIVCAIVFAQDKAVSLKRGESTALSSYTLTFDKLEAHAAANYDEQAADISVFEGGAKIGQVMSAKRFYRVRNYPTTEAGLFTRGFSQIYISLAEVQSDGIILRLYYKPLVLLIWLGCVVIAFGGLLSLIGKIRKARA
jgi:cytochrome c-type biogenesis protein CcmF